jgi:uncharacterized MAPEG superfamily protein
MSGRGDFGNGSADAVLAARVGLLNLEAAERSDVKPAQVLIEDELFAGARSRDGRPIVVGRHYAAHVDDRALLLYLLGCYAERAEPRGSNRRKSVRISFAVAVLVAAVVAVGINSNHLGFLSGLVLLVVVAAALYIPTVMVDARLSREFVERVDYVAGLRYGPGAVEAYNATIDYLRLYAPDAVPRAHWGVFSSGLSEERRRAIIAGGERAATDDEAAA